MRIAAVTLIGALGLASLAVSASAAPLAPIPAGQQASNIIEVAGGCGPGAYRNRWGHCRWGRYSHYGPRHRYYSYHGPRYYGWGPSSDYVANELNRQQLYRGY